MTRNNVCRGASALDTKGNHVMSPADTEQGLPTHRAGARVAGEAHHQAAGVGGLGADDHHGAVALLVLEVRLVQEGRQLLQRQRLRLQGSSMCCVFPYTHTSFTSYVFVSSLIHIHSITSHAAMAGQHSSRMLFVDVTSPHCIP